MLQKYCKDNGKITQMLYFSININTTIMLRRITTLDRKTKQQASEYIAAYYTIQE